MCGGAHWWIRAARHSLAPLAGRAPGRPPARAGVPGASWRRQHPQEGRKLPLTRPRARLPTSPRERGEAIGCAVNSLTGSPAAATTYANFGNEVLGSTAGCGEHSGASFATRGCPRGPSGYFIYGTSLIGECLDKDSTLRQIRRRNCSIRVAKSTDNYWDSGALCKDCNEGRRFRVAECSACLVR